MCGISGQFNLDKLSPVSLENLNSSILALNLRGPDGFATYLRPGVGLAHSRLSIIDLRQSANQPMTDTSGRFTIVFNGELLNFRELKKELNYEFKTDSDTEVLLAAYIKWKEKCVLRFRGFFSFVIYDQFHHELFAARDPFGIKPFIYHMNKNSFYFASELKSLICFPITKEVSSDTLSAFLQLSYTPGEHSIFTNVKKLAPGHFLKISSEKFLVQRYHDLNQVSESNLDFEEAKEKLFDLTEKAMDRWLISDAPIGAFLSGGIDSSIVVALASQKVNKLKTFSISFPDSSFHNEAPFAQSVANRYSTEHNEIPVTDQNIHNCVSQVLDYLDEPFADSSAIPTFALSQQVGKSIRVALSGDGADEVFGGYEKYKAEFFAQKWRHFKSPAKLIQSLTQHLPQNRDSYFLNQFRKVDRFLDGIHLNPKERYLRWCSAAHPNKVKSILLPEFYSEHWKNNLGFDYENRFTGINRTLFNDMHLVLPNDMLTKVDMMSMANSLEVRPILLDQSIVDFAFSLPSDFKVLGSQKKRLLLETFKHLLPSSVYQRPKHGFSVELMPFFKKQFWSQINDLFLNDRFVLEQGIFNPHAISKLKTEIQTDSTKDNQALIWALITFQNFWIKFNVGTSK